MQITRRDWHVPGRLNYPSNEACPSEGVLGFGTLRGLGFRVWGLGFRV